MRLLFYKMCIKVLKIIKLYFSQYKYLCLSIFVFKTKVNMTLRLINPTFR